MRREMTRFNQQQHLSKKRRIRAGPALFTSIGMARFPRLYLAPTNTETDPLGIRQQVWELTRKLPNV